MEHVTPTVAKDASLLGTLANVCRFSAVMLLDRDYKWCAETMLSTFGTDALGRAERRARELMGDGNPGGYEIWTEVAATIREIQTTKNQLRKSA